MIQLNASQWKILMLYSSQTYGIALSKEEAIPLIEFGLIEWVPPKFSTMMYGITKKGQEALEEYYNFVRALEGK